MNLKFGIENVAKSHITPDHGTNKKLSPIAEAAVFSPKIRSLLEDYGSRRFYEFLELSHPSSVKNILQKRVIHRQILLNKKSRGSPIFCSLLSIYPLFSQQFSAIRHGNDQQMFQILLRNSLRRYTPIERTGCPLHTAAMMGNSIMTRTLLEGGMFWVDEEDSKGFLMGYLII
uniref:ANK_REP_REGION domain-containing protein n=1 Tax=Parascaris equorum TaxID=6256 RepID=A0A914SAC9_PAREQ